MKEIYIIGESIITALGENLADNMQRISRLESGVIMQNNPNISHIALPIASIDWKSLEDKFIQLHLNQDYTAFEKLMILSAHEAIQHAGVDTKSKRTIFVISTTKGNIELLKPELAKNHDSSRIHLWSAAEAISKYFENPNEAIVISNACVSGVMAASFGAELLRSDEYDHAVVIGGDILSQFVVSGFQSFQSLSSEICKPYDLNRNGLNLGEAAGCIILSNVKTSDIQILAGASHNDANHISGPSRTAEGMFYAVQDALKYSKISAAQIDAISAHGTATPYNDEMEAIGLDRLGMTDVPIHSLKGFWGHTLGAAGIIEIIALIWSMRHDKILPTMGFSELGVSKNIQVSKEVSSKKIQFGLKIASGFSGINSALILKKEGGRL